MVRYVLVILVFLVTACKQGTTPAIATKEDTPLSVSPTYREAFRPQFHFSPPEKWMNDPNGLVFYKDTYHLFYQYFPEDIVWGPMHWGHATSMDMIHWNHKPIALYPDENGFIFSGSAVVDSQNTSGFGSKENPPMVAIYTYHLMEGEKAGRNDFQTQGIAYSLDEGATWEKFEGNPIIGNEDIKDFRDPKVFWHEASSSWILILVAGDHAKIYRSEDLKSWSLRSEFGKEKGAHGGVWECPDLFKLKVEETGEEKWVLLVSINPGAPNGGSGTQYFIGDFDGESFTTDQEFPLWVEYGRDNYAGVTYNNAPNGERLFIGWMSNWNYAQKTPTQVWRSAMTLPRNISLHQNEEGYFLKNYPIAAFNTILEKAEIPSSINLSEEFSWETETLMQTDLRFQVDISKAFTLYIGNDSEKIRLGFHPETQELLFDRSASGLTDFEESFGKEVQKQWYVPSETPVEVRVIVDQSSVEIFIDKGRYVFTNQVFPTKPYRKLILSGAPQTLSQVQLHYVKSIWNE